MKEKKLTITAGTDDFKKLVITSDILVDKSLVIKDIIDSGGEAILITRPRRWGKSLTLNMLATFLGIEVNADGNKLDPNPNRVLFEGGTIGLDFDEKKELSPLQIAREDPKYFRRQGQFPVIHISFKDVYDASYKVVEAKIRELITATFEQYYYLKDSKELNELQKEKLSECFHGKFERVSLSNSLKFLTELLHKHHGQKAYVLVDEYDKPVNYFLGKSLTENIEARTQVAELITSIMSACGKSNGCLEKIIITGILDAFKKEGASGFNNVKVFDIQHPGFARSFGFSQEEVESLVSKLAFGVQHGMVIESIKAWYNGYNVVIEGEETIQVYTPWAVMNYLSDAYNYKSFIPKSYWVESGVDAVLDNLSGASISVNLLDKLKDLAEDKSTTLGLMDNFHLFKSLTDESSKEALITYLLLSNGYISKKGALFTIPNNEVLHYFKQQVLKAWIEKEMAVNGLGNKDELLKEISTSLSDAEEFKKKVQALIMDKVSGVEKTENYFQSLVGGVIESYSINNGAGATHNVLSQKTTSFGRIDNIFYPRVSSSAGAGCAGGSSALCAVSADAATDSPRASAPSSAVIIHEYKKLDRTVDGELERVLDEAMWQMLEKLYLMEPLAKKKGHGHLHMWNTIKLRSVVFLREEVAGRWSIHIIEKVLTADQAKTTQEFFSDKLVRGELGVSNKSRKADEYRRKFLQALGKIEGAPAKLEHIGDLIDAIAFGPILHNLRISRLKQILKGIDRDKLDRILYSLLHKTTLSARTAVEEINAEHGVLLTAENARIFTDYDTKKTMRSSDADEGHLADGEQASKSLRRGADTEPKTPVIVAATGIVDEPITAAHTVVEDPLKGLAIGKIIAAAKEIQEGVRLTIQGGTLYKETGVAYYERSSEKYRVDVSAGALIPGIEDVDGTSATKPPGSFWNRYNTAALDGLLRLRLSGVNVVVNAHVKVDELMLSSISLKLPTSSIPTVAPIEYKAIGKTAHAVGIVLHRLGGPSVDPNAYRATYIDPENNPIPQTLVQALTQVLSLSATVMFEQRLVAEQSCSNNCAPELIEHFAEAVTGYRVAEDLVPAYHSELLAGFLWQEAGHMTREVPLIASQTMPQSSTSLAPRSGFPVTTSSKLTVPSSFGGRINSFVSSRFGACIKHLMYRTEVTQFRSMLCRYGIDMSTRDALSDRGFRLISLKLHPDKGGTAADFAFAQNLKAKLTAQSEGQSITQKESTWRSTLHRTNIAVQALDVAVHGVEFYQVPTLNNAKKTTSSSLHLYSMHSGFGQFSLAASAIVIAHSYYESGFYLALQQASITFAYMALPAVLAVASPCAAFAYSTALGVYTACSVVTNAYALYQSSGNEAHRIESLTAYRDGAQWLYESNGVEFFGTKVQEYEAAINITRCGNENLGSDGAAQYTHHVTVSGNIVEVQEDL